MDEHSAPPRRRQATVHGVRRERCVYAELLRPCRVSWDTQHIYCAGRPDSVDRSPLCEDQRGFSAGN